LPIDTRQDIFKNGQDTGIYGPEAVRCILRISLL
jgi:hypothetical protein